jgi:PAS domain-containing protein
MIAVEPDGGIAFANAAAERLFGFDGGELLRAVRVVLDTGRLAR